MKVVAFKSRNLETNGLLSSMTAAGMEGQALLPGKAIFDAFHSFRPDLFICTEAEATDELKEASEKFGTKILTVDGKIRPAANVAQLIGIERQYLKSDLSYVMLETPTPIVLSHIERYISPNFKRYLKIFGNEVPYHCYIGRLNSMADLGDVLASSNYLLDYLNNLVMDAWMNGCICVPFRSHPVHFPPEIFGRYEQWIELEGMLDNYDDPLLRNKAINKAVDWILDGNTYFHRAADLLKLTGNDKESQACLNTINELSKSLR